MHTADRYRHTRARAPDEGHGPEQRDDVAEALVAEGREERQAGAVRHADAAQERGAERGREVREDGVLAVGRRRPLPAPREEGLDLPGKGVWGRRTGPVRRA